MNESGSDDPFKNIPFQDADQSSLSKVNPFQEIQPSQNAPPGVDPLLFQSAGYVRQVRAVAICMIIQGALVTLAGIALLGVAVFMARMPAGVVEESGPDFVAMQGPLSWGYGIVGAVIGVVGLLLVFAGIRNLSFRGHTMGIVALSVGILTIFTCYCGPTGIGLAIWGMIVYFNPSVARAFQLADQGTSSEDILTMVARRPNW